MGIKLKRGVLVGKRGGTCTPSPTWRVGFAQADGSLVQDLNFPITSSCTTNNNNNLSARKLGANLWEVQPHLLKSIKMSKAWPKMGHRGTHHHLKEMDSELPNRLAEPPPGSPPPAKPESASSLRRHVRASLVQHYQSILENGHALKPVCATSYSSSMEVAPYNPAVTPTSSLELKGRCGDYNYNLKTSTELLKVLNRIWSLEEQHASYVSLVKALKRELDHTRAQVKELLRDKKRDQQEIDDLLKQIGEDKVRKNKDHDRVKNVVQSAREELEDERKLRKQSESLHRKLAREVSEVKSSFCSAMKELEREKKERVLLEDLCDEFAKGIREYEQEVRFLRQKPDKDQTMKGNPDRLILHISESWLDERMQMKQAKSQCDLAENNTIVDKLSLEIEAFLRAKQSVGSGHKDDGLSMKMFKEGSFHRNSLESFHLNGAVSAPLNGEDDEASLRSGSNSYRLQRGLEIHPEEKLRLNPMKKKIQSQEVLNDQVLPALQMQLEEEQISGAVSSSNGIRTMFVDGDPRKMDIENLFKSKNPKKLEIAESITGEISQQKKKSKVPTAEVLTANHTASHSSRRRHCMSLEAGKDFRSLEDSFDQSAFTADASTVKQLMSDLIRASDPELSESSLKWPPPGFKEDNTLKAKLLEARLQGKQSRSKSAQGGLPLGTVIQ